MIEVAAAPGGRTCAVIALDETSSTNTEAMARAGAGQPLPFWVVAQRQTAGRGRSGRSWESLPGNLHASVALDPACSPAVVSQLSLLAGVAVVEALRSAADEAGRERQHGRGIGAVRSRLDPAIIRLKWPNDILIGDAKGGGILVESSSRSTRATDLAVIGIGLDLVHSPNVPNRSTTSLRAHGLVMDPAEALTQIAITLGRLVDVWDHGHGFAAVRERWLACATPLDTPLTVHRAVGDGVVADRAARSGASQIHGRFAGLDHDGALLLRDNAGVVDRITYGDVTLGTAGPTDVLHGSG
jgi:BirA family biotin operon repressor/biotin-[acetyl-CoA-carboxylase] ligase